MATERRAWRPQPRQNKWSKQEQNPDVHLYVRSHIFAPNENDDDYSPKWHEDDRILVHLYAPSAQRREVRSLYAFCMWSKISWAFLFCPKLRLCCAGNCVCRCGGPDQSHLDNIKTRRQQPCEGPTHRTRISVCLFRASERSRRWRRRPGFRTAACVVRSVQAPLSYG